MKSKSKKWLDKPYYFNESNKFKLILSFCLGLFVFIFLVLFRPAGISQVKINPILFRLGYGAISTSVLLFFFFIFAKLFPKYYNNETWTVKKHLVNILGVIIFCGFLNWTYSKSLLSLEHFDKYAGFLKIFTYSVIIGLLPALIYIYFDERYHSKKFKRISNEIMNNRVGISIETPEKIDLTVKIYATNKKDFIIFNINTLIYVSSESNYASFYIKEGKEIKEHILRIQLQSIQSELSKYDEIIRCHKSYIINTSYITNLSGNARGYYLHFNDLDVSIPVSRKFKKKDLISFLN